VFAALALFAGTAWPRGRAALHSATVGSLSLALQFSSLYLAVTCGVNVGMIALVIGTMPIVTALLGLACGEAVRPLQWLGFAFGFGGVAMAVAEGIGPAAGAGVGAYLAVLLGLLALSAGTVYQKRLGSEVDLRSGLAVQHGVAALLVLPFAAHEGFRFDTSVAALASLAWVIMVNSISAFALFFVLLAINPRDDKPLLSAAIFIYTTGFAAAIAAFVFLVIGMRSIDLRRAFPAAAVSVFAFCYVALPLGFLVQVREQYSGAFLLLYLLLVVWA